MGEEPRSIVGAEGGVNKVELDLVLNELSIKTPVQDKLRAQQMMSDFIQTIRAARKKNIKTFRTHPEFNNEILAPDYPISRWRNDHEVDQVARAFFRTLQTKSPYLVEHDDLAEKNLLYSFKHEGDEAHGFGAAHHLDSLTISFRSQEKWHSSRIDILVEWLHDETEVRTRNATIPHVSIADHIGEHDAWIEKRHRASTRNGEEMWDRRGGLWSNLIFCKSVGKQMQELNAGDPMLPDVWQRLNYLQNYCENWVSGSFNKDLLNCAASLESLSVVQQFAKERTFRCPDGQDRFFEWHVKISRNAWRIHFHPLPDTKQIIIGYIGRHLPTANDPT
jgi:hypothetical protein